MSVFIMLQGISGSGKSTFIEDNNLEMYSISSDEIRLLMMGLKEDPNGILKINQEDGFIVWNTITDLIESRFQIGLPTILDATNLRSKNIKKFIKLSKKYGYSPYILRFEVSLEDAIRNDSKRPPYKVVGEEVIRNMYNTLQRFKKPKGVEMINVDKFYKIWRVNNC